MKKKDYSIAYADDMVSLIGCVKEYANDGWELFGNITKADVSNEVGIKYVAVMTKEVE